MLKNIDQRYFRYFDTLSFCLIIILASIGLLFVFSATYRQECPYSLFFKKQLFGVCSGVVLYTIFCIADYRILLRWGYFLYLSVIGFLIFTLLKGHIGMGGQRWIDVLLFKFQPSEVAKLFFPAFITYHLYTENDTPIYMFKDFVPIIAILLFSGFLIVKQPDLGTGLLLIISGAILLWITGLTTKFFILTILMVSISAPFTQHLLKPYQKQRISVFFGGGNVKKERYQLEQSKIAIGSGGLFGKGFLQGTQNKLMFLPESRTDSIFAVIGEEWGFFGSILIIMLYAFLFLRLFYSIGIIKNFHAQLLAIGLVIHSVLACIINMGMVTGLLPIVGIPLPLISYGISNLWITFASFGWINGIIIRQSYVGD